MSLKYSTVEPGSVVSSQTLIQKIYFPRLAIPLAAVLPGMVDFMLAFLVLIGPLMQLDQAILDVAPFSHVPKVPGAGVSAVPLAWLLGIAAALAAAGLAGFRRRDMVSTA